MEPTILHTSGTYPSFFPWSKGIVVNNLYFRTANTNVSSFSTFSIAGNFPPASCIFSEVMNLSAFFGESSSLKIVKEVKYSQSSRRCYLKNLIKVLSVSDFLLVLLPHRVHYCGPQIPSAETQARQGLAERRESGSFLCRLLWHDTRRKLPGKHWRIAYRQTWRVKSDVIDQFWF